MALVGDELENARFRARRADHSTTCMCNFSLQFFEGVYVLLCSSANLR